MYFSGGNLKRYLFRGMGIFLPLVLLLSLCLFPAGAMTAHAEEPAWPSYQGQVRSDAVILMDADSGAVLYAKNEHEPLYPASITKVLTAIITIEHARSLDDLVTFSSDAVGRNLERNATVLGAYAGDRLSVRECLYGLLLASANDCANALAEYISGSNEKFAELMNEEAKKIGCTDSNFANPSGLNDTNHYTSAMDMAKIMSYALQNETFREIDRAQVYTHAPIKKYPVVGNPGNTIFAHHQMMRNAYQNYYPNVIAGKTGYTSLAGNTLLTAAKRNGMTLVCCVLHSNNTQYQETKGLFDFAFQNFRSEPVNRLDPSFSQMEQNLSVGEMPLISMQILTVADHAHITLPNKMAFSALERSISFEVSPEQKSLNIVAQLRYNYGENLAGESSIYLKKSGPMEESSRALAAPGASGSEKAEQQENAGGNGEGETAAVEDSAAPDAVADSGNLDADAEYAGDSGGDSALLSGKRDSLSLAGEPPSRGTASQSNLQGTSEGSGVTRKKNHAPIYLDRSNKKIVVQKPLLKVIVILLVLILLVFLVLALIYFWQIREELIRKRRRARMLKHTKDLTRAQKARRDLMLGKKRKR